MAKQNFTELFNIFSANILNEPIVKLLADELGVSVNSLSKLGLGYHLMGYSHAFVIPERDGQGNIIGLMQRFADGKKLMVKGSKRGLIYEVNSKFLKDEEKYVPGKHNWERVSQAVPCPICGKADGCLVPAGNPTDPKAVVCVHISEGSLKPLELGFLHILKPEGKISSSSQRILPSTNKPIIVVEGHSDTAAAMDLGFVAVGRPSAEGGQSLLPTLLRGQEVIVVGDNDAGAGKRGMESVFQTLSPICKRVTKVLPPAQFKDLRQWKNQVSLTETSFLEWVQESGDTGGDPNILEDDVAHTIAKTWLERERSQDGLPTIRCYKSQWIQYGNGHYSDCDREGFRGGVYHFLEGKLYPKTDTKGGISLVSYKPTRAKVSDIIDALSDWCTIELDPPIWLKDLGFPDPANLVAFRNGLLDVNEYVQGRIKFYNPTPALFSFNILPYDFDEDAHSELWEQFYKEIFNNDKDQIRLLSQWFGYNCVPDMSYEKLMLCTGRPRSGKGTVLNTLAAMLGNKQCVSTSFQTLCTEFGYQPLMGKLAVLLGDAKVPRQKEAEAALEKILQVVGGDPVGIRRMYLPYLSQVYLQARFTIAMNDLPNIPDQANALEPKLNILYFQNSYVGREDFTLKSRLQKEAKEGKLINFALQGLRDLRQSGGFIIPGPARMLLKQLKELTTPVSAFIIDCCELEPPDTLPEDEYHVLIDHLYEVWTRWCIEQGSKPGVKNQFGRWFLAACPTAAPARIRIKERRYRIYRKVRLADWVFKEYLGVQK
ncbi:MAG TPA: hypothetical protein ENH82_16725 [bacterium]|nr:hypothetical protein [bacterium]